MESKRLHRAIALTSAAAISAIALSGCTGSPADPSESPSATTVAPSSSAPPTPQPATSTSPAQNIERPEMPEEAQEFSEEGLEAFIDHWVDTLNYAMVTGDTEPWRNISDEECVYCENQGQEIEKIFDNDAWIENGLFEAKEITVADFRLIPDGAAHEAFFTLAQDGGQVHLKGEDGTIDVANTFEPDEFKVAFFADQAEDSGWAQGNVRLDAVSR